MIREINQIPEDLYDHITDNPRVGQTWRYEFLASKQALANNAISALGNNFGNIASGEWPYQTGGKITMTTSGADDAAGTGAQEVEIIGIRTDWTYGRETLATNAGAQQTANNYFALLHAKVTQLGSGKMNAQAITFQGAGGELMGQIEQYHGRLHAAVFATAEGYYAHIKANYTVSDNGGRIYIILVNEAGEREVKRFGSLVTGTRNEAGTIKIPEKHFAIIASENKSGGAMDVNAEVEATLTKIG